MGTNFYLHKNACQCCKRSQEKLHIGKSSHGWCFTLHVDQTEGVEDLPDWEKLFADPANVIVDEYGELVTAESMMATITQRARSREEGVLGDSLDLYPEPFGRVMTWGEFYERNQAEPGPNNLLRHRIDPEGYRCVKHGEGTWDCVRGEFS